MNAFPFMVDPAQAFMTATLEEFEKILGKGVTGEPIQVGDVTLVPIFVTTFGVGAAGGSVFGEGLCGGGGGGVVPCAIMVVGPSGVEIKSLQQEFVTNATNAHAQVASDLSSRYSKDKTQVVATAAPATTSSAAPVTAPVGAA